MAVERDLATRLLDRSGQRDDSRFVEVDTRILAPLGLDQRRVAASLVTRHSLLVVEGAAGAGKTRTLAAAHALLRGKVDG